MSQTVHLVRHGKVENPGNVIYGRLPGFHLSELGRKQAASAAGRLAAVEIGAIWSSPLERAQETAAIIGAGHDVQIRTDERLIESGTTLEGVGRTLKSFLTTPAKWWSLRAPWRPSWGESFVEIRSRMEEAIGEAMAAVPGGNDVVIVSHETPVLVARLALARRNVPPWLALTSCDTGSITSLTLDDDGSVISASYFVPEA